MWTVLHRKQTKTCLTYTSTLGKESMPIICTWISVLQMSTVCEYYSSLGYTICRLPVCVASYPRTLQSAIFISPFERT